MEIPQDISTLLEKANQVAAQKSWQALATDMLALLQEICQAEAAVYYPPGMEDAESAPLAPWRGQPADLPAGWWEALRKKLQQPALFQGRNLRWIERDTAVSEPGLAAAFANLSSLRNVLILPLAHSRGLRSGVALFNSAAPRLSLAGLAARRLETELEKAADLEEIRRREARLMALNEILGQLGASLNPDQVLRMFIERARQFLQVEAVSLFLVDEDTGELVLKMASQADRDLQVEQVRVPPGAGIIGKVTQTGETLLIEDARADQRHYAGVDLLSGFTTRSILAVPLRSRPIDLGQGRGKAQERIIGGLEAINKIGGSFMPDDIALLHVLAQGASTILVVVQQYVNANTMFIDVIQSLVAAIDNKDPRTAGRSERISAISAAIARALGLPDDDVYHIRLGSLFHSVGPSDVSTRVLGRTGSLRKRDLRQMPDEGTQAAPVTPDRLREEQIPLYQQIVAVAEAYEDLTADRPDKPAVSPDAALSFLSARAGTRYDRDCVAALLRAHAGGDLTTGKLAGVDLPA